jgi:hypothetical protein
MAVKNYFKEFVVFSGFNVHEFAAKGYMDRINLLKERFVGKKRVFRVRLRRGDRSERMLLLLVEAEELPEDFSSPSNRKKSMAALE